MNILTSPTEALAHDAEQQRARIWALSAGPELDAEISLRVFHQPARAYPGGAFLGKSGGLGRVPPYSSDPGAAWLVVLRLVDLDFTVRTVTMEDYTNVHVKQGDMSSGGTCVVADTMPLAVARAALLAKLEAGR